VSCYVHGSRMSYKDYLQAKSFVDDVRWDISQANLNLIATNETLQKCGVRLEEGLGRVQAEIEQGITELSGRFDDVDRTLVKGFITLHSDLLSIDSSVQDLSAKFEWGFSQLLISLGSANESLAALVKLARTPEQTWALEQYEIARDAFRRSLFREALDYVERAINGYQGHTGYSIEHRFHSLLGVIRLGSFKNNSRDIVDLEKAYAAFLSAARYAMSDYRQDAARALCGAAQAAYCLGRFDASESHASEALRLNPRLGEATFQLAKTLLHGDNTKKGLPALAWALRLDPLYSLKAFDDPDFTRHESAIRRLLEDMREELAGKCRKQIVGSLTFFRLGTERLEAIARHAVALNNVSADRLDYQCFLRESTKGAELAAKAENQLAERRYLETVSAATTCRELLVVAVASFHNAGAFIRSIQTHLVGAPDRLIANYLSSRGHGARTGLSAGTGSSGGERAVVVILSITAAIVLVGEIWVYGVMQSEIASGKVPRGADITVPLLNFALFVGGGAFALLYWLLKKPLTGAFARQAAESQSRRDAELAESQSRRDADLRAAAPVACKKATDEIVRYRDVIENQYTELARKLDELKLAAVALIDQKQQPVI
jgi:tetratricopeptide (TPR) repeat protein